MGQSFRLKLTKSEIMFRTGRGVLYFPG